MPGWRWRSRTSAARSSWPRAWCPRQCPFPRLRRHLSPNRSPAPTPTDALPPPFEETVPAPPVPVFEPAPARRSRLSRPSVGSRSWARAPSSGSAPITLALAAVFLVRYSIEEGYLSPEVRVILAALFGFVLIGGAEAMKSRDDRVAQAMAAAGVAALYGALFAAVALYGMVSQTMAGIAAGALTAFAIGLSLRHGPFVAGLAFIGGFASPAIIGAETPNTPVLFGYLFAIAAGTMAVIRHRGWWMMGWGVLAGSAVWTVAWMFADVSGLPWVALFLVAVAGLFVWTTWRRLGESDNPPIDVVALVWAALASTGVLLAALILFDEGRQTAGWVALGVHGIGLYALGRWTPRFQYVAVLAPVLSLATLGLWWLDALRDGLGLQTVAFGTLYAVGAFALMWNAGTAGLLGSAVGGSGAHPLPVLLVGAALRRRRHAVGPDQHRVGRAIPGRRRAAGALARAHDRRHRGAGLPCCRRVVLHRCGDPARAQPRMDHGRLRDRTGRRRLHRRPAGPGRHAPALLAVARRRAGALRAQSRGAALHADLLGLCRVDRGAGRRHALHRRRPLAPRRPGRRRAAALRAADPGGPHAVRPGRHRGARSGVLRALGLCRRMGHVRAGGPLDRAAAPRSGRAVGMAAERRAGGRDGRWSSRCWPPIRSSNRPMSASCRSPTACCWPTRCRRSSPSPRANGPTSSAASS